MKRVFIVHGWASSPEDGWFPWLKKELEQKGFQVEVPAMPDPDEPKIESWVQALSEAVGRADEDTFFVGHSIGCQTILRFLERLPADQKIGGMALVAGWLTLQGLETDEEEEMARPWLEKPIQFEKVKAQAGSIVALFSDDDPFVPRENEELFEKRLGAKIIVEHGKGHFSEGDGVKELPSALEAVLAMAQD